MKRIKKLILGALLSTFIATVFAETVEVYIPPDVLLDYQKFLDGREPEQIRDFSGDGARRDVIEVILFQQALNLKGRQWDIRFVEQPEYGAMLDGLESGEAIASVTSLWRKDLTTRWSNLYITTAVIERGQFEAGFYTPQTNAEALQSRTNQKLKSLKGVSSRNWVIDWRTLENFGANVQHADTWGQMVEQVFSGESDYLLAPFQSTDDLSLVLPEGTLVPIPNVKIALMGTRHFAVSRTHPMGQQFNNALHRGLMEMKKNGTLVQAYADCGFLNQQARDWREVTIASR
jgi:hypothetical protein